VAVGVPVGVLAAKHANRLLDRLLAVISVSFITMPVFVVGLLLLLAFAVHLRIFPAIGVGSVAQPGDYLHHLVLPACALAITWIGYIGRLVRANMLEVLGEGHVRTARAQGIRERTVFYKLVLKNALIPVVAVLGVGLGSMIGGAIFVEIIFDRPGIGSLIYNAIETRNYPVVRGGVLVVAVLFVLANLIADLLYRFLDPRVRVEARGVKE
jgi:peptide/nickel transport system permease protein